MNSLLFRGQRGFSLKKMILDNLYMPDRASESYRIINSSIHTSVEGVEPIAYQPNLSTYTFSKLPSGITVLTESVCVPANIQLGIMIDMGTRDEDAESSGAMLSIKNTYLKTAINTNETVNYGIAQMAGGRFEVEYNRENIFYRVNCLSHDVIDVFSMAADCAFEPKNFVSAGVGAHKNVESHKLESYLGGNESFNDALYSAAFGNSSLGMPIQGRKNNVANLSAYVLQRFQRENITPERVVISATGVENHQEFVDLVQEKMFSTQLSTKGRDRSQAQYVGGEVRNLTESSNVHIAIAFEGASHRNSLPLAIAETILGSNFCN
jgi:predicted Zn-dependent peptidase